MNTPYFRLQMGKDIVKPPKFEKLPPGRYPYKMNSAAFNTLDDLVVAYYRDSIGLQFPDFLHDPTFMMSTPYKKLLTLFDPSIQFKGIQLYPQDITRLDLPMPLYWIPHLAPTDCLHESSIFYSTGLIKQLVVDSRKTGGRDILKAKGTVEEIWLVSLVLHPRSIQIKLGYNRFNLILASWVLNCQFIFTHLAFRFIVQILTSRLKLSISGHGLASA